MDVKLIREDFPILKRRINGKPMVYLANAATTQKPKQVLNVIYEYYANYNSIIKSTNKISTESSKIYERAREKIADFIGANPNEIIFTKNATEAINLVSYGYGSILKKKNEIITTQMEHHANIVPWQNLEKTKKIKLRFLGLRDNSLNLDDLDSLISKKTKLIAVTHVSNVLGKENPIKDITKIAHDNGSYVMIDGTQSVSHMPVNVRKLGCDFFAFSAHKMLGPLGVGCLYVKREVMKEMRPFICGGNVKNVTKKGCEFIDDPERLEGGTQNTAGIIGFASAIDYLSHIGMKNVEKYSQVLTDQAVSQMRDVDGVNIYGYGNGIVSFNVKQLQCHDVASLMSDKAIMITAGAHNSMPLMEHLGTNGVARMSTYVYNTADEIKKFVERLKKISSLGTKRLIVK